MKKAKLIKLITLQETAGSVSEAEAAVDYWRAVIEMSDWFSPLKECVVTIAVNTKQESIGHNLVSVGSANESICNPRDVFGPLLPIGAVGFILMHNHPSGKPAPSEPDRRVTKNLKQGADLLGLEFLDHVIVPTAKRNTEDYFSFREAGLL